MVAPIIIGDINNTGFGSPPVNSSGIGIEITAENVDVSNIRISNFSTGMKISSANAHVHNVDILLNYKRYHTQFLPVIIGFKCLD